MLKIRFRPELKIADIIHDADRWYCQDSFISLEKQTKTKRQKHSESVRVAGYDKSAVLGIETIENMITGSVARTSAVDKA